MHISPHSWLARFGLASILIGLLMASPLAAQFRGGAARTRGGARQQTPPAVRTVRSRNFLVHTDLDPKEARELLKKLETMLRLLSNYYGQPNRKPIECYVVEDLGNWPQGSLAPDGRAMIADGAGVTLSATQRSFRTGRPVNAQAVVYATSKRGTPLHEAVHAYCAQNFGDTGPTWYSEGMAELGNYWRENESSVLLPNVVLEHLQTSDPKPLLAIVDNTDQTGDSWQNYAWRWALCYLLLHNENYSKRFRPLGLRLIANRPGSFEQTYGNMSREIAFEYHFLLEHLDNGLRADLIAWDWNTKFLDPRGNQKLITEIQAQRGWQPSRVLVKAGKTYQVTATGTWRVEAKGETLSADGQVVEKTAGEESEPPAKTTEEPKDEPQKTAEDESDEKAAPPPEGAGKLMGIVLDPATMSLGEPFELGSEATFTAEGEGWLYFRCKDAWGQLADNKGEVEVVVRLGD